MTKNDIMEEILEMVDNGADHIEVFEWVEENTDLDPAEVVYKIFYR